MKNNPEKIFKELKIGKKMVAMIAPSFIVDFSYPSIIHELRCLGFDKIVELTFGAKLVNREYHKKLKKSKYMLISSTCPGVVNTIKNSFPEYSKNIAKIDSPMIAMGKICRKEYPKHKIVFISPCDFKKQEAESSDYVDYVIDYEQLKDILRYKNIKKCNDKILFDKFYNDYTKIYPLSGGLGETAHLKGIVKKYEVKSLDGIKDIIKFMKKPDKKIKFLDCLFCNGGCIGGPHTNKNLSIAQKKRIILDYLKKAKIEDIPENRKGLLSKAKGLKFYY